MNTKESMRAIVEKLQRVVTAQPIATVDGRMEIKTLPAGNPYVMLHKIAESEKENA